MQSARIERVIIVVLAKRVSRVSFAWIRMNALITTRHAMKTLTATILKDRVSDPKPISSTISCTTLYELFIRFCLKDRRLVFRYRELKIFGQMGP